MLVSSPDSDREWRIQAKRSGQCAWRFDGYEFGETFRDGKKGQLESQLSKCVASLLWKGRHRVLAAKLAAQREMDRAAKERERQELAKQIAEEEKKVKQLETWVTNWKHAQDMREFINLLVRSADDVQGSCTAHTRTARTGEVDAWHAGNL